MTAGNGRPTKCLSGRPSLEELRSHTYHQPKTPARPSLRSLQDHRLFGEDDLCDVSPEEDQQASMDDVLFQGLLAIGTLGQPLRPSARRRRSSSQTPLTPSSPRRSRVGEGAGAGAWRHERQALLARPSHVSQKHLPAEVCPLQVYLFGSTVEMAETSESAAEKKEHRVSLGELFMKSRVAEEAAGGGGGGGGKKGEERERSPAGMHLMVKKMLKRRCSKVDGSSNRSTWPASSTVTHAGDSVAGETKFHKVRTLRHGSPVPLLQARAAKNGPFLCYWWPDSRAPDEMGLLSLYDFFYFHLSLYLSTNYLMNRGFLLRRRSYRCFTGRSIQRRLTTARSMESLAGTFLTPSPGAAARPWLPTPRAPRKTAIPAASSVNLILLRHRLPLPPPEATPTAIESTGS
ncbi:unnamed protein product [Spirodela intermedia]|uniref:Uncharacterized protein n=1 Tax=Spirodela intermedia TaxID=51605 RepID=A0A7I8IPR3_SPIIN|nr:unnamed protein product [Spirodela intermedia]CAA6659939.1 unnamed protein product [Spirodela intermedia]